MKLKRVYLMAVAVLALTVGAVAATAMLRSTAPPHSFEAVDITGVDWGKDLQLTDHTGRKRSLADFRGRVVTLFFGYTQCPDVCPTTMARLSETMTLLGDDARLVQGLFMTVDPKRDTPEVLAQYVPSFHPSFLGLYGDPETTAHTAKEFKVYFHLQPPNEHGSYSVDHSGQILVFDAAGLLRLMMKPDQSTESMARDLRALIREAEG
jgi:protein SCO1/2